MPALLTLVLVWADIQRGPWYDEFYTQFVSRPDLAWGTALRESWLPDNHPPLYYALARLTAFLGPIPHHRFLNLALGALAVAGGVAIVRDVPRIAPAGVALTLALAANHWTIVAGTELRSYFLSLCAIAVLVLGLCAIRLTGSAGGAPRRLAYGGAALLAFNTHIVTSLTAAALVTPFLCAAIARRDWREARAVGAAPLVSGLVLLAVAAIQLPLWLSNTGAFWIPAGFDQARFAIQLAVLRTVEANPVVLAGAVAGAAGLAGDVLRRRTSSPEAGAMALLACGAAIAIVGLVTIHMMRPLLIEKYCVGIVAAVAMGLALGFARMFEGLRPRGRTIALAVAMAGSVPGMMAGARAAIFHTSWFASGRAVAARAALCPGTLVHAGPMWNDDVTVMPPHDNALVVPYAYRSVAATLGFRLAPEGSRALSVRCPTIFWGEHDTRHRLNAARVAERLRAAGFPETPIAFTRIGTGWMAVAPPDRR